MKLTNITKAYNGKKIIRNLSLVPEKGTPICIFGPSGCGKTTLLNIIAGLVKPDEGTVLLESEKISYVFQEDRLINWISAEENIFLTASNEKKAWEFIYKAGLEDCLKLYPLQMSGGMRRRTAIARAVAKDGEILLLDEPFNGIDKERKEAISRFLKGFAREKICIMVSHDMLEADMLGAEIINFIDINY
ncbi:taurine import ATP-binding protein TauB [Clostridiales bacterium]|nr:taurine import ATP-binding protein TauB [Clostridiales bacterium]